MKKWICLFSILLLLNITVFLYLSSVSNRLSSSKTEDNQAEQNADWLSFENQTVSEPANNSDTENTVNSEVELASAPQAQTSEAFVSKEEIASAEEQEQEKKWCIGDIELKEKDYAALKSKLTAIPHQAKKVEKTEKN